MATQFENTLIVYYSRTGRCSKIAHALSQMLDGCDVERIEDERDMTGMKGLTQMSVKALMRKGSEIKPTRFSPEWYDEVFLVTPVWAGSITPAIRTYLKKRKIAKLTLIACSGWTSESGCKDELHREYGITVNHHVRFVIDEVDEDKFRDKLRRFVFPNEDEETHCQPVQNHCDAISSTSPSGFMNQNKEDAMSKNSEKRPCCSSNKTDNTDAMQKSTAKNRDCSTGKCNEKRSQKETQACSSAKNSTDTKCCGARSTNNTRACGSAKSTSENNVKSAKNARGNIVARSKNNSRQTTNV